MLAHCHAALVLSLLFVLLVGCGAPSTPIKTDGGEVVLSDIQLVDRHPPGCSGQPPSCFEAAPGTKILMLWAKGKDGSDAMGMFNLNGEVYVTGDGLERSEMVSSGWATGRGSFVAFQVPESAKNFTLHWPGNDPLPLGR